MPSTARSASLVTAFALGTLILCSPAASVAQSPPAVDHHQHLLSPDLAAAMSSPAQPVTPITAAQLVPLLDAAGIERAVVLSTAYIWTQPFRKLPNDYERVRADNDWTSQQVARFPRRLIGFCSVNPLKDWALAELERCARDANLRRGLKIHIGNSAVDYGNPEHMARLRRVFVAANQHRTAIVVHMRASITEKLSYGRTEATAFLDTIIAAAPDITIQIAHLAGAGSYSDPKVDEALSVFIDAIQRRDPRVRRVYFDISGMALSDASVETVTLIATRLRQVGIERILYGTDAAIPGNLPRDGWASLRRLPLTESEFTAIAANVAPYLR